MISVVNPSSLPPSLDVSLLRRVEGMVSGTNLGGRFALPAEFDQNKFASAFVLKGAACLAMQTEQPVVGTGYVSDAWAIWKYPGKPSTDADDKSSKKNKKKKAGALELVKGGEHPLAGQSHEVVSDKDTYVLMFRPLEVQKQVNALYGHLSRQAMVAETLGQTLDPEVAAAGGMLPKPLLDREQRDIEADREFEENQFGRSSVVDDGGLPTNGHKTRRRETTVHK